MLNQLMSRGDGAPVAVFSERPILRALAPSRRVAPGDASGAPDTLRPSVRGANLVILISFWIQKLRERRTNRREPLPLPPGRSHAATGRSNCHRYSQYAWWQAQLGEFAASAIGLPR